MAIITTTKGPIEEALLERTTQFTDSPKEFVVSVEWRLAGELVRRDAHLILKQIPAMADAVVEALAGV